jgi:large subunit ribosomal protein L35
MPKVKTRKILTKRFKVTKTGKLLRGQSFTSHLKVKKSSKHRRRLSRNVEVTGVFAKKLKKVLGI